MQDAEETTYDLEQPMYLELNAQKDFYFNICQYQYDLDKGDVNPDLNQRKNMNPF